jgi:hypothetical protein
MLHLLDHNALTAYIDGGSASLFFQALIAGILATGFMMKNQLAMVWQKVRSAFNKKDPSIK